MNGSDHSQKKKKNVLCEPEAGMDLLCSCTVEIIIFVARIVLVNRLMHFRLNKLPTLYIERVKFQVQVYQAVLFRYY